jgi:hypothetical protein
MRNLCEKNSWFVTIILKMLVDRLSNLLYYKGSLCTILLEKYQNTS